MHTVPLRQSFILEYALIHRFPFFRTHGVVLLAASLGLCALAAPLLSTATQQSALTAPVTLHNGWKITPAGTHHEAVGDLLLGGVISPDGRWLAFVNGGAAAHQVHLADAATGAIVSSVPVERAQSSGGVAFSKDGKTLYVSGGNAGRIYVFTVNAPGKLLASKPLVIAGMRTELDKKTANPGTDAGRDPMLQDARAQDAYLGGLTLSPNGETLYVTNLAGDSVFALHTRDGAISGERTLLANDRPSAITISPDGKTLYVALWGKGAVVTLNAQTMERRNTIAVGSHPNTVLLTKDGKRLFVACGNDDSVYTLDTVSGKRGERINLRMTPRSPAGATPSALALSPDEKTLYVANSDNNAVAVVNVTIPDRSRVEGFIPTTFYPTLVAVSRDNKRLFIGSGKGYATGPNNLAPGGKIDPVAPKGYPYIVDLLKGVLSTVPVPNATQLSSYTKQVYANSPYRDELLDTPVAAPAPGTNAIPSKPGAASPIKHVLYIIKENRTYDQVLGDMKDASGKAIGNGDPNLCLFGEDVTPNHHALARDFVLLDNLYANGEVSVDGHLWSNGAYVPDAVQRTWPSQYGSKGAPPINTGDFGDPLAETPNGRIWDLCDRAKLSYKTYYYHVDKHRSDAWSKARKAGTRDYDLADIYVKDVAQWEKSGEMPRFMVMALSEDHTKGTRPGTFTPKASVASNDLGLGKIVEACSKSRFWKEMAIFVIEDDAQNGPDHVDAHRTVALAISPYTRRGSVDSTFYSTCSLLRTMELILGVPPMSQYDAAATPLYTAFTATPDTRPFTCLPARIDLQAKNTQTAFGARASMAMNLSEPDQLTTQDEDTLNRVLWHSVKGATSPYPGIVRRPLFNHHGRSIATAPSKKDEDD